MGKAAVVSAAFMLLMTGCGNGKEPFQTAAESESVTEKAEGTVTESAAEAAPLQDNEAFERDYKAYQSIGKLLEPWGIKFGTVINYDNLKDTAMSELAVSHFNSLTAGNEMKAYSLLDQSASQNSGDGMPAMDYRKADAIISFAQENGIQMRGHVLVWDAYMTDWFFREKYDTDGAYADSETLKKRLESYITQVISYFETEYPGIIYCWDVVNEAVGDGAAEYRAGDQRHVRTVRNGAANLFYELIGEDYVELSFLYAKTAVEALQKENPEVEIKLFYNDYNAFYAEKRDAICELVRSINSYVKDDSGNDRRLCDGVGMQGYIGGYGTQSGCMNFDDIKKIREAILKYAQLGEVQITEMAVRNYKEESPFPDRHADFYRKLFEMVLSVNGGESRPLTGLTIWGLVDRPDLKKSDYGYKMNSPYCGLFDENYQVKKDFSLIYQLLEP